MIDDFEALLAAFDDYRACRENSDPMPDEAFLKTRELAAKATLKNRLDAYVDHRIKETIERDYKNLTGSDPHCLM